MEFTELFMFKADWQRTFIGSIDRSRDIAGNPIIYGKVDVNGMIYSCGATEDEIGLNIDEMIILKLDHEIHAADSSYYEILGLCFNLN